MNETLQKINELLKLFNNTFKISVSVEPENGENIVSGLKIDELKNDGSEFISELFSMFDEIVQNVSNEHELIYNESKGLVIAKKVVKVDYIIED